MKFTGVGDAEGVLFVSFNQDHSRLAVGTKTGYKALTVEPFKTIYETHEDSGTAILEMLFGTSLVAYVGAGTGAFSPNCLRMVNFKREKEIIRMNYNEPILAVRLNRKRLVVLLSTIIYIYDISSMHLIHTTGPTPENPNGICALASCHIPGEPDARTHNFLAYPGEEDGTVFVYDTVNLKMECVIKAHSSKIACLALSSRGDKVATASAKGTVIKVFSTKDGRKLCELRRGRRENASIYSMSFNLEASLLCASSDRQTIHLFKLEEQASPDEPQGWSLTGLVRGVASSAAAVLPTPVSELWTQLNSFAQIRLDSPVQNICALSGTPEAPVVLIATARGMLLRYAVNMVTAEASLISSGSFIDQSSLPAEP